MADKDKRRPMVVSRHGRYRFQSGMVTATLLQRGLAMVDAFAISSQLRDRLRGRSEITTDALEQELQALVLETLGPSAYPTPKGPVTSELIAAGPMVRNSRGLLFPFSRGILLRYLVTAGLEPEPAMALAQRIGKWLAELRGPEIDAVDMEAEVERRLTDKHGAAAARRYRLTGLIRRTDKPVIILIGGATGTGKSTLATELAFRLGIRLVTSTDMIRETMRTVLPAEVVPGLHDHSFRGMLQGGQVLSDPRERVLVGFRQQAAQVAVGIRGVIGRAVREQTHMIVEGTHIVPPFSQYVPPDAEVIVAGLIMAVPEEGRHRQRFPERARKQGQRSAEAYLEAFQSVRWIHDDLLAAAEDERCVVVANETLDQTVTGVVEYLSQSLPFEALGGGGLPGPEVKEPPEPAVPTLFLILDGLSDEPNPALGGKTPLAAADARTLRMLAGAGGQGLINTGGDSGVAPETDEGLLALLGFGEQIGPRIGRGLLEALGHGFPLPAGAVVFRGNLATVQPDGVLADRRAGRIRAGVADLLADLHDIPLPGGVRGTVHAGHEHRVVVVLQGPDLSDAVSDTDPGGEGVIQRVLPPRPMDGSAEAARTVAALAALLDIAHRKLDAHPLNVERKAEGLFPANCLITRGAGSVDDLPRPRPGADRRALISGCSTALGVARAIGLQPATTPLMTGNLDTNLDEKFRAAGDLLADRSFVAVHIKGTDIAAHDRRPLEKRDFISAIDAALGRFLTGRPEITMGLRVVVSADHGTSSITGNHLADPVPLLLATWQGPGEEQDFDEESAANGALGLLLPGELAEMLWER
jgi:2,3-bisphosphoglycerate-independent phosphoglycerate mutase